MGVYTDLLAAGTEFPAAAPREGLDRATAHPLLAKMADGYDPTVAGDFAAVDEVQVIGEATGADGGTYTLEITLYDGTNFTTAAIAFDANAATIEAAIDTASPATVPAGDISVTGGPLPDADVTLTFDGDSVAGQNHGLTVVDDASLTNGTAGDVTVTAEGQPSRSAMKAMYDLGIVVGAVPAQGETPTWTKNENLRKPRASVIRDLARRAAIEEANDAILTYVVDLYSLGVE